MIRRCLLAAALLAAAALAAPPADARSEKVLAYPKDQAWSAALRFLVVDEKAKVTEKDSDAGYVVFDWRDDGKSWRGSLELVATEEDGRKVVRFVVQLADRPSWLEAQMLVRLEDKLRHELGAPTPPRVKRDEPKKDEPKKDEPRPDEPKKDPAPIDDGGPTISPTP